MRVARWVLVGSLAVGGLAGTAFAHGQTKGEESSAKEEQGSKVTMDELPSAVRSTLQKEAKGGTIEELRTVTKNGKTYYLGEVVNGERGTELKMSEDGTVLHRSTHNEAAEKKRGEE